jgi:hypothetical protein
MVRGQMGFNVTCRNTDRGYFWPGSFLDRKRVTAGTTFQSMKPETVMRSATPSHGVGRFAAIRGPSILVKAPNTARTTIVPID